MSKTLLQQFYLSLIINRSLVKHSRLMEDNPLHNIITLFRIARTTTVIASFAIGISLCGCTNLKLPTHGNIVYNRIPWKARYKALNKVRQWQIDGAFSIQQPQKNIIAAYTWQQHNGNYTIAIHSSLDLVSIEIYGNCNRVILRRSNTETNTSTSPEALMQQQLGWQLPISNLFYWIKGIPAQKKYTARFDGFGHLQTLTQDGWTVNYSQYLPVGSVDLPQILSLQKPPYQIKIVIKHWKI